MRSDCEFAISLQLTQISIPAEEINEREIFSLVDFLLSLKVFISVHLF